jgi:hypothetical protein
MARKYIRRLFSYPLDFLVANGNALAINGGTQNQAIIGDVGIVTVFTHFSFRSTGDFLIQLRPSDLNAGLFQGNVLGRLFMTDLNRPGMLPAEIVIQGANSMRVELTNDSGALVNEVRLAFHGYRDYAAPAQC